MGSGATGAGNGVNSALWSKPFCDYSRRCRLRTRRQDHSVTGRRRCRDPGCGSITAAPCGRDCRVSVDATFTLDEMLGFDRSALQQILESTTAAWLCEISDEGHMVEASSPVVD